MIAFVTQPDKPDITPDDQLAADLLVRARHEVRGVPWTAGTDWTRFDSIVVRSPWDYHQHPREFYAWLLALEQSGARVYNPASLLRWNSHKRYLLDLAARGIPIVPTTVIPKGARPSLAELLSSHDQAVLKPAIAAGSIHTWVTSRADAASHEPRLHTLLATTDVLLQPYLPQIATVGEYSLIFFNHTFSHAVLKRPKPADFRVQEKHGGSTQPLTPPQSLIDQAAAVLRAVPAPHLPTSPNPHLLYARVDGVLLNNTFTLMELEALEPALFLSTHPDAPRNFATAILSTLPS